MQINAEELFYTKGKTYIGRKIEIPRRVSHGSIDENGVMTWSTWTSWFDEVVNRNPPAREGYHWYEHDGVRVELPNEINMEPEIPTNFEIRNSTRLPELNRSYPTSRNPTQERRRRNA